MNSPAPHAQAPDAQAPARQPAAPGAAEAGGVAPPPPGPLEEVMIRFAGGVAHDFSNFLAVISGFTQLLRKQRQDDAELVESLEEILQASDRAAKMVDHLAVLAGQRALELKVADLNPMIQQNLSEPQALLGDQVQLVLQLSPTPVTAKVDPVRFQEILTTLCEHARSEMPQGGRLTITTASCSAPSETGLPAPAKAGEYVRVSLQDTGKGMEPDLVGRIFEPFFFKSRLKRGTGLGLPFVHALVRQHAGAIAVETALGQGTTFHLYFPAS